MIGECNDSNEYTCLVAGRGGFHISWRGAWVDYGVQ